PAGRGAAARSHWTGRWQGWSGVAVPVYQARHGLNGALQPLLDAALCRGPVRAGAPGIRRAEGVAGVWERRVYTAGSVACERPTAVRRSATPPAQINAGTMASRNAHLW